jgi:hypothetical protein
MKKLNLKNIPITIKTLLELGFSEPSWGVKNHKSFFFPNLHGGYLLRWPDVNEFPKKWSVVDRHETGYIHESYINNLEDLDIFIKSKNKAGLPLTQEQILYLEDLYNKEIFNRKII